MGDFIREFYKIPDSDETKVISLLIKQALKTPSVYFEVRHKKDQWSLYWLYEMTWQKTAPAIKEYAIKNFSKHTTLIEASADTGLQKIMQSLNKIYSCPLNPDDIDIILSLCKAKIEPLEWIPRGLDGHDYEITLFDQAKSYKCWCIIPKEWVCIIPFISMCIKKAGLGDRYNIAGIR